MAANADFLAFMAARATDEAIAGFSAVLLADKEWLREYESEKHALWFDVLLLSAHLQDVAQFMFAPSDRDVLMPKVLLEMRRSLNESWQPRFQDAYNARHSLYAQFKQLPSADEPPEGQLPWEAAKILTACYAQNRFDMPTLLATQSQVMALMERTLGYAQAHLSPAKRRIGSEPRFDPDVVAFNRSKSMSPEQHEAKMDALAQAAISNLSRHSAPRPSGRTASMPSVKSICEATRWLDKQVSSVPTQNIWWLKKRALLRGSPLKNEDVHDGPLIQWIGEPCSTMIGSLHGVIYKVAVTITSLRTSPHDLIPRVMFQVSNHLQTQGIATPQGLVVWDANDGNVVLQQLPDVLTKCTMFVTSQIARSLA